MDFTLNTNNAKQAGVSTRIDTLGAYEGTFIRAEAVKSDGGTVGIELAFKSDNGQSADYLTLWTNNKDGKELYGRKVVDAIMVCLRLRGIKTQVATYKKYDPTAKQEVQVQGPLYPELMNKRIGVMLVREEYLKRDQTTAWKMALVGVYDADTTLTPSEILDRKNTPEQFTGMLASLRDRPLKNRGNGGGRAPTGGAPANFADMDDDIPF